MALLTPFMDDTLHSELNVSLWDFSNHTHLWIKLSDQEIALKTLALLILIMIPGVLGNVAIVVVFIRIKVIIFFVTIFFPPSFTLLFAVFSVIIIDINLI